MRRRELVIAFLLSLLAIAWLRWAALATPFFWDEAGFYAPFAYTCFRHGLHLTHEWVSFFPFPHTPLYPFLIGTLARAVEWSLASVHAVAFVTGGAFISGSYAFFRLRLSRLESAALALALLLKPVVLSSALFAAGTLTNATLWVLPPAFAYLAFQPRRRLTDCALFFAPAALGCLAWLAYYRTLETGLNLTEVHQVSGQGYGYVMRRFAFRVVQIGLSDFR